MAKQICEALITPDKTNRTLKEIGYELTACGGPNFDLIIEKGTAISVLKARRGEQFTVSILGLLINDFCSGFNVVRPMNDGQAADLAEDLVHQHWSLKLEDFVAFFALAKKEYYGRVLDRIDPGLIFGWLGQYEETRLARLMKKNDYDYSYEQPRAFTEADKLREIGTVVSCISDTIKRNGWVKRDKTKERF